ncbi:TlpA family protein disulfide reductase [Luteolibacter sp. Populi]|uniref:TlpA family protein disulfide reductase n=1 Tax=Luteolibacter sp. Populi TaxID=3230487 RepID=UPI00346751FC
MKTLPSILAALLAFAAPAFADKKDKDKEEATVPDVTVDKVVFPAEVVNGVAFDKAAIAGKVLVVEEWGVNCAPCIASLPDMAKLAKRFEKKGLVVVGLERQGSSKEDILKAIKPSRLAYPIFAGGSSGVTSNGIPHACVFGTDGKLIWHGHPADDKFEDAVKDALKGVKAVASN